MHAAAVITISDTRSAGSARDESGPVAASILRDMGLEVVESRIIPDERDSIARAVTETAGHARLVVTTGGTGIGLRDVTPEAVGPLFDKELPGFGEVMRVGSFSKTPLSIISRGGAGIIGRTLVFMLPGSRGGVRDGLGLLGPAIKHVLKVLATGTADCARESNPRDAGEVSDKTQ